MSDKIIVKLSTAWKHSFFYNNTPGGKGVIGNYKFEIDNEVSDCDYWIIWGGLSSKYEKVNCPKGNIIFVTDEVHSQRHFFQEFLDQFSTIITPRLDLEHKNIINSHELNTWHLNKSYDELFDLNDLQKTKSLCVISSNLFLLPGHQKRYEFVNKIIGHFKDKIDVYGRGSRPFNDKFKVLAPYKYSIAIENNVVPGYFTEKLSECFLTNTIPIYYGCPNLSNYFDSNSFYDIDIQDYKSSILKIEAILEEDNYYNRIDNLLNAKHQFLTQFDFFHGITKILDEKFNVKKKKEITKIKNEIYFERYANIKKLLYLYNCQSFIPKKYKFNIEFHDKGKFSGKY